MTGGAKILICIQGVIPNPAQVQCVFNGIPIPVTFIQPQVVKCNAPASQVVGLVDLNLTFNGVNITHGNKFEYRERAPLGNLGKRIKDPMGYPREQRSESEYAAQLSEREFKVRIIERLGQLEQKLSDDGRSAFDGARKQMDEQFSALFKTKHLDPHVLDLVSREYTVKILEKILSRMKTSFQKAKRVSIINEVDDQGYALIHYFTHVNYSEAVKLLADFGADINLKVGNLNEYPLYIAAAKGFDRTIQVLIQNGALLNSLGRNDQHSTMTEVIEIPEMGQHEALQIALENQNLTAAECMLRGLTLKDAIEKGVKKEMTLTGLAGRRRRNSTKSQDANWANALEMPTLSEAKSVQSNRKNEILDIKKKYHIHREEIMKIQKIQRRVRAWLLKRSKFDIESASELLHSAFLSDSFQKKSVIHKHDFDEKAAAIIIQRTVRNWLKDLKD